MNAPTIAQLKLTTAPESLWHFLAQLPKTIEAQMLVMVILCGVIGLAASWLMKWSSGQAACGFIGYFFRTEWRRTVATWIAYLSAMLTGIGTGVFFTTIDGADTFVGWYNVAWASLTTAFGCDMGINKGKRVAWSAEQRDAAALPPAVPPPAVQPQPKGDTP